MREKEVEAYLNKRIKEIGGLTAKLDATFQKGVPDRVVVSPGGRVIFVEVKSPTGRLGPMQKVWEEKIRTVGVAYRVVWSKEDVEALIDEVS